MKLATLTMKWHGGEEPMPGHYLASKNGHTAYLILEMIRPTKPDAQYSFKAICERRPRTEMNTATVWWFKWNKR